MEGQRFAGKNHGGRSWRNLWNVRDVVPVASGKRAHGRAGVADQGDAARPGLWNVRMPAPVAPRSVALASRPRARVAGAAHVMLDADHDGVAATGAPHMW